MFFLLSDLIFEYFRRLFTKKNTFLRFIGFNRSCLPVPLPSAAIALVRGVGLRLGAIETGRRAIDLAPVRRFLRGCMTRWILAFVDWRRNSSSSVAKLIPGDYIGEVPMFFNNVACFDLAKKKKKVFEFISIGVCYFEFYVVYRPLCKQSSIQEYILPLR